MSVSTIGAQAGMAVQQLISMRDQYTDLQRQLSTGQKSATYAGLGIDRGMTISLNAQLSAMKSYSQTIDLVGNRISLMNTAMTRMNALGTAVKTAMVQANTAGNSTGVVNAQTTAKASLDELLGLLNTQSGNRYLFSGTKTDTPAVETMSHILDGDGAKAGLKQIISERSQADMGADGMGRLSVTWPTPTSVQLDEDATSFGMKMESVDSTMTGATITGPIGDPAALNVDFSTVPNEGESFTIRFTMPDGSTENLTLTGTSASPPGDNQFTLGASAANNAVNFQDALKTAIGKLAGTANKAASAVAASNEFFAADANNPVPRVDGPPFDTAMGMRAGTSDETVTWYTGDTSATDARASATAQVDQTLSVSYGARANETGIRKLVQNIATLAAVTIPASDSNATALSQSLNKRLAGNINDTSSQTLVEIQSQIAAAQTSMTAAKSRQQQTSATLTEFSQQITGVSNEEVGSAILALQTRMQASMQTTAMLFQTSLVNYLK